jgi:hypothetical protein
MEFPENPINPQIQPAQPEEPPSATDSAAPAETFLEAATPEAKKQSWMQRCFHWVRWAFIGDDGLRAGWSVAIFAFLFILFSSAVGFVFVQFHLISKMAVFTPNEAFFEELIGFLAMVGAAALVALIERRRSLLAYNLTGTRRIPHFIGGLAAGFTALSLLVGVLAWGNWLHFGPVALSGAEIFKFGAIWAAAFLLVGCYEEGMVRCYLQFTLTRGINFWWALGILSLLCLRLILHTKGNGVWGVYAFALLGLFPCLMLHIRKTPRSGFWQAAWVTSTLFGYIHTGNNGEDPIGIFAAALIGFAFCVSIWVTGSAWWAIGCHAAWDWAETYFYGAADSGNVAVGHYLSTSPFGNALWSGGADGPEGSLLVVPVVLLLMVSLLVIYRRRNAVTPALPGAMQPPRI